MRKKNEKNAKQTNETIIIDGKRLYEKNAEVVKLVANGYSASDAYALMHNGKRPHAVTESKIRKLARKYSLTQKTVVKEAHKAVMDTLQLKEVNDIKPSATNRLMAAQMVYDRLEPVIKNQTNIQNNVINHPVDLSKYALDVSKEDKTNENE